MNANEYRTKKSVLALAAVFMMVAVALCAMVPASEAEPTVPSGQTIVIDDDSKYTLMVSASVQNGGITKVDDAGKEWKIVLNGVSPEDMVGDNTLDDLLIFSELAGMKLSGFFATATTPDNVSLDSSGYNVKTVITDSALKYVKEKGCAVPGVITNDGDVWTYTQYGRDVAGDVSFASVVFSKDSTDVVLEYYAFINQTWELVYKLTVDCSNVKTEVVLEEGTDRDSGEEGDEHAWAWDGTNKVLTFNDLDNQDALVIPDDSTVVFNDITATEGSEIRIQSIKDSDDMILVKIGDSWVKAPAKSTAKEGITLTGTIIVDDDVSVSIANGVKLGNPGAELKFQNNNNTSAASLWNIQAAANDKFIVRSTEKGLAMDGAFSSIDGGNIIAQKDIAIIGSITDFVALVTEEGSDARFIVPSGKSLSVEGYASLGHQLNSDGGIVNVYLGTGASVTLEDNFDSFANISSEAGSVKYVGVNGSADKPLTVASIISGDNSPLLVIKGTVAYNGQLDALSGIESPMLSVDGRVFFGTIIENTDEYKDEVPYVSDEALDIQMDVEVKADSIIGGKIVLANSKEIDIGSNVSFYPYLIVQGILFTYITADGATNVAAFDGETIMMSGSLKASGGSGNSFIIIPEERYIAVLSGTELTIGKNITVCIEGELSNAGTLTFVGTLHNDSKKIYNSGILRIPVGTDASKITDSTRGVEYIVPEKSTGLEDYIKGEVYFSEDDCVYLVKDTTIGPNATLTIDGTLDLKGKTLTVQGSLILGKNAYVIGNVYYWVSGVIDEVSTIVLDNTGEVVNDGLIGFDTLVHIHDTRADCGCIEVKNVSNIQFTLTDYLGEKYLTMYGKDVSYKGDDNWLYAHCGAVIGDMNIRALQTLMVGHYVDEDEEFVEEAAYVLPGATFSIGPRVQNVGLFDLQVCENASLIVGSDLTDEVRSYIYLCDGASVQFDANPNGAEVYASTQPFRTYDSEGQPVDPESDAELAPDYGTVLYAYNVKGFTVYLDSVSYDVGKVNYTEQRLNIRNTDSNGVQAIGDESYIYSESFVWYKNDYGIWDYDDTVDEPQKLYIAAGEELTLPEGVYFESSYYDGSEWICEVMLAVDGVFKTQGEILEEDDYRLQFIGTYYVDKDKTKVIVPFNEAISVIDDVKGKTLYVSGGYVFDKDFVLADDQIILDYIYNEFGDDFGTYGIDEGVTVTVENGAEMRIPFTVPSGIKGILNVAYNGICTPESGSYEVKKQNDDRSVTYTSVATAIDLAQPGETISIVSDVIFSKDKTIPEGVTVILNSGCTMTAEGDLNVLGTLEIKEFAQVNVGGDLNVPGKVVNDGLINMADGTSVNATGTIDTIAHNIKSNDMVINGASVQMGEREIFTSFAKAVELASGTANALVTIHGTVVETSDVALSEGMRVQVGFYNGTRIYAGDLTVPSVTMNKGSVITTATDLAWDNVSSFTGTIKGFSGQTEIVNTEVKVDAKGDFGFRNTYSVADKAWTFEFFGHDVVVDGETHYRGEFDGSMNIVSGTVVFGNNGSVLDYCGMLFYGDVVIGSGAVVVVPENVYIDFVSVFDETTYIAYDASLTVNGTLNIAGGLVSIGYFIEEIDGTYGTDHENASMDVYGTVNVTDGGMLSIFKGYMSVMGTVDAAKGMVCFIGGESTVGSAPLYAGAGASVSGNVCFGTYVVAYANADMSGVNSMGFYEDEDGSFGFKDSKMTSTAYYVDGVFYATAYALMKNEFAINDALSAESIKIPGKAAIGGWKDIDGKSVGDAFIGDVKSAYLNFEVNSVVAKLSQGTGLKMYIDGLSINNFYDITSGKYLLVVGDHTVSYEVESGYNGDNVKTTVDGKVVTNGKFNVSVGASTITVAVDGAVPEAAPEPEEDKGLQITDILLIVLVILIIVMAAIVAMKMMRS